MDYEGRLYGKLRGVCIPLVQTTEDIEKLQRDRDELLAALERVVEYHVPKINPLSDAVILSARAVIDKMVIKEVA